METLATTIITTISLWCGNYNNLSFDNSYKCQQRLLWCVYEEQKEVKNKEEAIDVCVKRELFRKGGLKAIDILPVE